MGWFVDAFSTANPLIRRAARNAFAAPSRIRTRARRRSPFNSNIQERFEGICNDIPFAGEPRLQARNLLNGPRTDGVRTSSG